MSRTLRILMCFFTIVLSVGSAFLVIDYQKERMDNNSLVMLEKTGSNALVVTNKLNFFERLIIYVVSFIFVCSTIYLAIAFWNLCIKNGWCQLYLVIGGFLTSLVISCLIISMANRYILVSADEAFHSKLKATYILKPTSNLEILKSDNIKGGSYSSKVKDENVILIKNNSEVLLQDISVNKIGNCSNSISSKFYGINAGILVLKDALLDIQNSSINTEAKGSTGMFATLSNSSIHASNVEVDTVSSDSSAITASFSGEVTGTNLTLKTESTNSPVVQALRGGKVTINSSTLGTNGSDAPLVHADGTVAISSSTGDSNASYIALLENNGTLVIKQSKLKASGLKYDNLSDAGIMFRKTMYNNDFDEYAQVDIYKSSLAIKEHTDAYNHAPFFFVSDNNAIINVFDSDLSYGSNTLLKIDNEENKNVLVEFNLKKQKIGGKIITDDRTNLKINLDNSSFEGSINSDDQVFKITLTLDKDSIVKLTDDSYVSIINNELTDYHNIITNGHTLYYDKDLNPSLNGKTIVLDNGGKIEGV